jgi:hypothetical protein
LFCTGSFHLSPVPFKPVTWPAQHGVRRYVTNEVDPIKFSRRATISQLWLVQFLWNTQSFIIKSLNAYTTPLQSYHTDTSFLVRNCVSVSLFFCSLYALDRPHNGSENKCPEMSQRNVHKSFVGTCWWSLCKYIFEIHLIMIYALSYDLLFMQICNFHVSLRIAETIWKHLIKFTQM